MSAAFLDDATFVALRSYIRDLTGIDFPDGKRYLLESRVRRRAQKVGSATAQAYMAHLRGSAAEVEALVDEVTTNETSFFRHERQMQLLRDRVAELAQARRAAGQRSLRLWSAACSSGEEPYSMALIVLDVIPDIAAWDVRIDATDISTAEIGRAREADYSERQIQTVPAPLRGKHFVAAGAGRFRVADGARRLVRFTVGSLLDDVGADRDAHDIVLCRNVLIYFDAPTKTRVLDRLYDALRPGGYLMLGPSDSLHGLSDRFRRTPDSAHNLYRKPDDATPVHRTAPAAAPPARVPAAPERPAAGPTPARPPQRAAPAGPATGRGAGALRERMLILRLDSGLRDMTRDLEASVDKTVERLTEVATTLGDLAETAGLAPEARSGLRRCSRQLTQAFMHLQVGDRGQQKLEAMRMMLQELSDRLFETPEQAIDLQVRATAFDESLIPADAGKEAGQGEDEEMSQDDIDSLFG